MIRSWTALDANGIQGVKSCQGFKAARLPLDAVLDWLDHPGDLVAGTPFQSDCWLRARYESLVAERGVEPLPVAVRSADNHTPAMLLPLLCRRRYGVSVLEFADLGLTDYNAPLLGSAAPKDRAAALAMLGAVRAALPRI